MSVPSPALNASLVQQRLDFDLPSPEVLGGKMPCILRGKNQSIWVESTYHLD